MFQYYGKISYKKALQEQMSLYEKVKSKKIHLAVMGLEHEKTITLGKRATAQDSLIFPEAFYIEKGFAIAKTDRGGQATIHNPGQLVVYPIINLNDYQMGVREYVCLLQKTSKGCLNEFGLKVESCEESPGLFYMGKKIGFIGIRIKEGISYHGISLNINNDLSDFENIVSCGVKEAPITSTKELLQKELSLEEVFHSWWKIFEGNLEKY